MRGVPDNTGFHIVRSDGATFDISATASGGWMVPADAVEGVCALDLSVVTSENVLTDGSSLISKRVNERDRTVKEARYFGPNPDQARADAISFFNPKFSFAVHATYRGRTRWCEGELYAFESAWNHVNVPPTLTFTILCCDPFMLDENGNDHYFTDAVPMFGFPYVSHVRKARADGAKLPVGSPVSKLVFDGENTIYNGGDVDAPFVIACGFDHETKDPVFTLGSRLVKVVYTFQTDDVLRIDFTASPPEVTINGQNAIQKCSRDSSFVDMTLKPGDNTFYYDCAEGYEREYMRVQLLFNARYLGV